MNNVTFGNERVSYYETVAGGAGAGPGWHGRSGVHTHMTNTRITDPEILEKRWVPLAVGHSHGGPSGGGVGARGELCLGWVGVLLWVPVVGWGCAVLPTLTWAMALAMGYGLPRHTCSHPRNPWCSMGKARHGYHPVPQVPRQGSCAPLLRRVQGRVGAGRLGVSPPPILPSPGTQ